MILSDEHGEVEVKIGDQFEVEGSKFSVICPKMSGNQFIWVRLLSGFIDLDDGRRVEVKSPDDQGQPFLFGGALLAGLVRNHRLMTFDIPAHAVPPKAKPVADTRRAPASKKRAEKHQPTSESLF